MYTKLKVVFKILLRKRLTFLKYLICYFQDLFIFVNTDIKNVI